MVPSFYGRAAPRPLLTCVQKDKKFCEGQRGKNRGSVTVRNDHLMRLRLGAASHLYQIKAFVTHPSTSSLQSVSTALS
jgi:hypothetical protein